VTREVWRCPACRAPLPGFSEFAMLGASVLAAAACLTLFLLAWLVSVLF
jgi:hypothetical protein